MKKQSDYAIELFLIQVFFHLIVLLFVFFHSSQSMVSTYSVKPSLSKTEKIK